MQSQREKLWKHSSAGSEHLPYKQGVTGSNPVVSTLKKRHLQLLQVPLYRIRPILFFPACGKYEVTVILGVIDKVLQKGVLGYIQGGQVVIVALDLFQLGVL